VAVVRSLGDVAQDERRCGHEAADELRKLENASYAIRARIFLEEMNQWRDIAILNIDGPMIEWKERA
jgi:hypothetical protein